MLFKKEKRNYYNSESNGVEAGALASDVIKV